MSTIPAGDMANALFLRRQTATLKGALARHSRELTTGTAADPLRALGGDTAALAGIERSRSALKAHDLAATETALFTAGQQKVLDRLGAGAIELSGQLLNFGPSAPGVMIDTAARIGRDSFEATVSALNTRLGDRSLFAGAASDRPALAPPEEMLAALLPALEGLTTAEDVAAAVTEWVAGDGFETGALRGDARPGGPVAIAPGESVSLTVTAAREELRPMMTGLLLSAVVAEGVLAGDTAARAELLQQAALRLAEAPAGLTALASEVGTTEGRVEAARARNANESTALELALNDVIGVDAFDAATRLEETRVRVESLFTLTARLQRLSLTEFLR